MVDETLVSYEYHYRVSFRQILKIAYFRLIYGQFPLIKSQNQNPMLPSVNIWDKNLISGIWFPYTLRQLDLRGWTLLFEEHPTQHVNIIMAEGWSRFETIFCLNFKHKIWSIFWGWSSVEMLKIGQYFESDVWLRFKNWTFVEITKLNFFIKI